MSRDVVRRSSSARRMASMLASTTVKGSTGALRRDCAAAPARAASTAADTTSFFMDSNVMTRTVLVTGASSGIGEAFASVFAAAGWDLVITARREDRLRALAERLERQYGRRVHVITADLAAREAPARLCEEIAARGLAIDALVNNAGYGMPGAYVKSSWAEHDTFI